MLLMSIFPTLVPISHAHRLGFIPTRRPSTSLLNKLTAIVKKEAVNKILIRFQNRFKESRCSKMVFTALIPPQRFKLICLREENSKASQRGLTINARTTSEKEETLLLRDLQPRILFLKQS